MNQPFGHYILCRYSRIQLSVLNYIQVNSHIAILGFMAENPHFLSNKQQYLVAEDEMEMQYPNFKLNRNASVENTGQTPFNNTTVKDNIEQQCLYLVNKI